MVNVPVSAEYPWFPWDCRGYPFSADEEHDLVAQLARACRKKTAPFRRGHVSILMDVLRSGLPLSNLRKLLPGLNLRSVYNAYQQLDDAVGTSNTAWSTFFNEPHDYLLVTHAAPMSTLLPVPFAEIVEHLVPECPTPRTHSKPEPLSRVAQRVRQRLHRTTTQVTALETALSGAATLQQRQNFGLQLFNPYDEAAWEDPFFHPNRVGQLSLLRVSNILDNLTKPEYLGDM